jgi:hypothetical protein
MEEWKDIKGYEAIYQVSNLGNVRSLDRINYVGSKIKGTIMKQQFGGNGYLSITLCGNGKQKKFTIHRLVATAFVPNPCGYEEVNHKDEIKYNNFDFNLEWCDRKYNMNYGTAFERMASKLSKEVFQYDINNNFLKKFKSTRDIERQLGYANGNIGKCCNGKLKTAYGYIWGYGIDSEY